MPTALGRSCATSLAAAARPGVSVVHRRRCARPHDHLRDAVPKPRRGPERRRSALRPHRRARISLLERDCIGAETAGRGSSRASCGRASRSCRARKRALAATGARIFSTHILAFLAEAHLRCRRICGRTRRRRRGLARGGDDPRPQLLAGALAPQGRAAAGGLGSRTEAARAAPWQGCGRQTPLGTTAGRGRGVPDGARSSWRARPRRSRSSCARRRAWRGRGTRAGVAQTPADCSRASAGGSRADATSPDLVEARALLEQMSPVGPRRPARGAGA